MVAQRNGAYFLRFRRILRLSILHKQESFFLELPSGAQKRPKFGRKIFAAVIQSLSRRAALDVEGGQTAEIQEQNTSRGKMENEEGRQKKTKTARGRVLRRSPKSAWRVIQYFWRGDVRCGSFSSLFFTSPFLSLSLSVSCRPTQFPISLGWTARRRGRNA